MQLGKALVGAIIGAAVGIGLLFLVYKFGLDKVWLAIPFAFIVGLGVRMLVNTAGHASYARGALTMVIALAAYIGGWRLVATVATARANTAAPKPVVAEPIDGEATDADGEAKDVVAAQTDAPKAPTARVSMSNSQPNSPANFGSTWDVIWLAVAALIAYEMGRGTGIAPTLASQPAEPIPGTTHPDA